ncbi:MAG: hypothetical protein M1831_004786 [Alyxoria varia]|nr:MAG: hypothetical protein M1831_004786 [Alyxoria varia]
MDSLAVPLVNLEVAHGVASQVEQLAQHADAHTSISDEAAAKSVLAASALPAVPPSGAPSGAATTDPPNVPSGDKFAELANMMMEATKPPADQAAAGHAPASTVVSLKPDDSYLKGNRLTNWNANQGMLSLAQLYSGIVDITNRQKRGHPDPYKITVESEALQAYADQADSGYNAMIGPLAGFYIFSEGALQTFKKTFDRAQFHLGFLGELFKGFDLSDGTVKALDSVLTNFASAVGQYKFEQISEGKTINRAVKINNVPAVNISGNDNDPLYAYPAVTTFIYMKVTAKAWKTVMSKMQGGAEVEHIDFEMYWTATKCTLNTDWYNTTKPKFDKISQLVTGKNLEAFGAMLDNPITEPKQNESQPPS